MKTRSLTQTSRMPTAGWSIPKDCLMNSGCSQKKADWLDMAGGCWRQPEGKGERSPSFSIPKKSEVRLGVCGSWCSRLYGPCFPSAKKTPITTGSSLRTIGVEKLEGQNSLFKNWPRTMGNIVKLNLRDSSFVLIWACFLGLFMEKNNNIVLISRRD